MNIKASSRYQIYDYKKAIRVYYLVIFLIIAFFGLLTLILAESGLFNLGGIEFITSIFLFVAGLNSFKELFLMMLQNSISRKTMFISKLITISVISIIMAVIDRIIINIGSLIANFTDEVSITSFYDMIFEKRVTRLNGFLANLEATIITILIYILLLLIGYFITAAYYRMNKVAKTVVSISVPSFFLILLPLLDTMVFNGK